MLVMKFGGTSVGSGECILHVANIILAHLDQRPVVVTSAMSGVTDALLALARAATRGDAAACESQLAALMSHHQEAARAINAQDKWEALHQKLDLLRATVEDVLMQRDGSTNASNALVSWGERLAVVLVAGALNTLGHSALACDQPIIATDDHALPLVGATRSAAYAALAQAGEALLVMPGFIAQMPDGRITTLGRGGSDYSATLLAAALPADACWIYTDVDGIMSADPRIVQGARILPMVSPRLAGRLSYSGAKVLHPQAVAPVARLGIPLRVRNTFRPDHPGTLITAQAEKQPGAAQAISGRRNLAAITFAGDGLPEVPHLFGRLCQAMTRIGIEIVLSVHPGTGYDPQIIMSAAQAETALEQLREEFASECAQGQISGIALHTSLALCTLIGEGLDGMVLTQVQHALASAGLVPLVQTANPAALSLVLRERELERALQHLHHAVIEPGLRRHSLGLAYSQERCPPDDGEEPERRVAACS
jgi:aspartate kinase